MNPGKLWYLYQHCKDENIQYFVKPSSNPDEVEVRLPEVWPKTKELGPSIYPGGRFPKSAFQGQGAIYQLVTNARLGGN